MSELPGSDDDRPLNAIPDFSATTWTCTTGGGGFNESSSDETVAPCAAISTACRISLCTHLVRHSSGALDLGVIDICKCQTVRRCSYKQCRTVLGVYGLNMWWTQADPGEGAGEGGGGHSTFLPCFLNTTHPTPLSRASTTLNPPMDLAHCVYYLFYNWFDIQYYDYVDSKYLYI